MNRKNIILSSEESEFGNELETLNFTTQSLLIDGISMILFKEYIGRLLSQARHEYLELDGHYADINLTTSANQLTEDQIKIEAKNMLHMRDNLNTVDGPVVSQDEKYPY